MKIDRCVPDGTKTVRFMPFPAALLSDGAGDVPEYHVLRRQRSHVFLTLRFAQREDRDGSPFIRGLCSAQPGEQNLRR